MKRKTEQNHKEDGQREEETTGEEKTGVDWERDSCGKEGDEE